MEVLGLTSKFSSESRVKLLFAQEHRAEVGELEEPAGSAPGASERVGGSLSAAEQRLLALRSPLHASLSRAGGRGQGRVSPDQWPCMLPYWCSYFP